MNNVIRLYEQYGGLLRGHFLLSSGLHSDTYLQSEKIMMFPQIAAQVVMPLMGKIRPFKAATIVSPAIGGIRFGYELARQCGKKAIFTERVDSKMTLRRGFEIAAGELVIVAEDVITTGKSTKECIEAVKEHGGVVEAVVSIIDRSGGTAEFGVPYIPLAQVDVKTWEADDCPLCQAGDAPVKPGSRTAL